MHAFKRMACLAVVAASVAVANITAAEDKLEGVSMPDGSLRIWYASRKKPPFVNKYFAINTAVWNPATERASDRDARGVLMGKK